MAGTELHGGNGHEERDVDVRAVTKVGLGITFGVIVAAALMWFLFNQFAWRETSRNPAPQPMTLINPQTEPPEPRLQSDPRIDLKTFRAAEEAVVNSYGWVDPAKGIVRIPVDRALELVAKEGLPARKEAHSR